MNLNEVLWLTAEDVRVFHEEVFYPAPAPGERPERPIDGPLENVINQFFYRRAELDIVLIAAFYGHDIARAHCFHDGNKRTALKAVLAFLDDHGFELALPNDDTLVPIMEAVAEGVTDAAGLYATIIDYVKPSGIDTESFLVMIGMRVQNRRTELGMSRKKLAEESGVSERYLAQLESGRGNISIALLRNVAIVLGVSLEMFMSERSESQGEPPNSIA